MRALRNERSLSARHPSGCCQRRAAQGRGASKQAVQQRQVAAQATLEDDLDELEDVDADLEAEMESFLKQQDTAERGFDPQANEGKLLGADEVDEEQAKAYCRDIVRILRMLKEKRDMPVREAKLVIQIEDPTRDEARKLGVEDARGVSREEMGFALEAVAAGKLPSDRIALRALHTEMVSWPFLESENKAAGPSDVEAKPAYSAPMTCALAP